MKKIKFSTMIILSLITVLMIVLISICCYYSTENNKLIAENNILKEKIIDYDYGDIITGFELLYVGYHEYKMISEGNIWDEVRILHNGYLDEAQIGEKYVLMNTDYLKHFKMKDSN